MLIRYFPPDYSGSGMQAARLARALSGRGVLVHVLTTRARRATADAVDTGGGTVVHRLRSPRSARALDLWLGLRATWWLAVHRDWDLLHIHSFGYFAVFPTWIARWRHRPVIVKTTLLGGDDPQTKATGRLGGAVLAAYRSCRAVVALSETLAEALSRDGHFEGRIRTIPNGVDTDRFRPAGAPERESERDRIGLPRASLCVVAVGALVRRKNAVGLAEAIARVAHRPLCLVLAGPDAVNAEERRELDRALGALPAEIEVRRTGQLDGAEIAAVLRACDVFVLSSRAEGLPNALLEAMASGLACIATDVSGSRDVLSEGGGLLVPVDDPAALAEVIDELAANSEARLRLGSEALKIAEQRYSLAAVADRYLELYASLARGPLQEVAPT